VDEPRCPLCGGPEHRDADRMIMRCELVEIERTPQEVFLRELFY